MGRHKKNEQRGEHFAKMKRSVMESEAWRAISPTAQALYPWLLLEWKGPMANNNGKIRLSVRSAGRRVGVSKETAARAFHDLQAKGFLVVATMAHLGTEGEARGTFYELTEIQRPGSSGNGGSHLYRKWRPGKDFDVQKAQANNPTGRRKKKSRLTFEDRYVVRVMTNVK